MYSTITTVIKNIDSVTLIQLLNDEGRDESAIDLEDSTDAIVLRFNEKASAAQEEIDPYLRGRYTLPLSTVPKRIIDISNDLTIYNCYKHRSGDNIPDSRIKIRNDAIKFLQDVQARKQDLGLAEESEPASSIFNVNKTSSDKIFNNDLMSKY